MQTVETSVRPISIDDIKTSDTIFSFREPDEPRVKEIKNEIKEWGQFYPVTLEEVAPNQFRILDGFSRVQSLKKLSIETNKPQTVQANVYRTSEMDPKKIFSLLYQKNFLSKNPYSLMEQCRCISFFNQAGISVSILSQLSHLPPHTIEDYLDLSTAETEFFNLITDRKIDPQWAVMLHRRYLGWIKTKYHYLALTVVKKLLAIATNESLTMKKWRFYLDFYWDGNRPSLAAFK